MSKGKSGSISKHWIIFIKTQLPFHFLYHTLTHIHTYTHVLFISISPFSLKIFFFSFISLNRRLLIVISLHDNESNLVFLQNIMRIHPWMIFLEKFCTITSSSHHEFVFTARMIVQVVCYIVDFPMDDCPSIGIGLVLSNLGYSIGNGNNEKSCL